MAINHLTETQVVHNRPRVGTDIFSAIRDASEKTGVDFQYMMQKAQAESSFQSDIEASTSSATGLYQFIEGTWLDMVKRHGHKYGLSEEAASMERMESGRYHVTDPDKKSQILDLRKDPKLASLMAAEFAAENQRTLEHKVGGEIGRTDLYLAHFMGAGGASSFLTARMDNPNQLGADLFPQAAKANHNVFYTGDGQKRTLDQIYHFFDRKFGDQIFAEAETSTSDPSSSSPSSAFSQSPMMTTQSRSYGTNRPPQALSVENAFMTMILNNRLQSFDWL